jgi:putative endonuclease
LGRPGRDAAQSDASLIRDLGAGLATRARHAHAEVMTYYVYILASRRHGTLYTGVTNELGRRIFEHREGLGSKFVRDYRVFMLVYAEAYDDPRDAIAAEKRIKRWRRAWKIALIEKANPEWRDLSADIH